LFSAFSFERYAIASISPVLGLRRIPEPASEPVSFMEFFSSSYNLA